MIHVRRIHVRISYIGLKSSQPLGKFVTRNDVSGERAQMPLFRNPQTSFSAIRATGAPLVKPFRRSRDINYKIDRRQIVCAMAGM